MAFVCSPGIVNALDIEATAFMFSEYTNNASNSERDKQSDIEIEPGLELSGTHNSAQLSLDAQYRIRHRMFLEDIFDDETVVTGNGRLNWMVLPDRFEINATQFRDETTTSTSSSGTFADRRRSSRTSVAPSLLFRFRGTDLLRLTYEFRDRQATDVDIDNTTNTARVSYTYAWGPATNWTLSTSRSDIEYSNTSTPDLEVTETTLEFSRGTGGNLFRLTGGGSNYEREGLQDVDGAIGSLLIQRQLAAKSSLRVRAERQITDDSTSFIQRLDNIQRVFVGFENSDLSDVLTETSGDITLDFAAGATDYYVSGSYAIQDYEELPNDVERFDLTIGAERQIRPTLGTSAYLRRFEVFEDLSANEFTQYDLYT